MTRHFRQDNSRLSVAVVAKRTSRPFKPKRNQPRWLRRWRYLYIRFLRLRGTPTEIARGLALGVFAGCFPLFGFQIIMGILLAALFRSNKIVAAAGTWISNPITYVPIFIFNFKVGLLLLGGSELSVEQLNLQSWQTLMESGFGFVWTLFFGCFVVGSLAAFCTYFLGLWLIFRWRESRQSFYRHRSRHRSQRKRKNN